MGTGDDGGAEPEAADVGGPEVVVADLVRRHLRFGFWSILAFMIMGLVLESLHGFKVAAYLNVGNETRRLLWTLAHAHGALFGLVHVAVGCTLRVLGEPSPRWRRWKFPFPSICARPNVRDNWRTSNWSI